MKNKKLLKFLSYVFLVLVVPTFGVIICAISDEPILRGVLYGFVIDVILCIGFFAIVVIDWLSNN